MTHSLFIKSHSRDFPWLEYCRDSVRKFCSGFDEVVLCLPEGETFDWPESKIVHVRETFTGYLFQQAVKLFADQLCSGDFITFQDSDTIFTAPVTPDTFKIHAKPYWITRPYEAARSDQQVWRKPTSDFLGRDVPFEGMYRHPFTVPRGVLQKLRGFCQFQHGITLDEYIRSKEVSGVATALTFSEWNAVGAFAWFHCKEQFHWIDAAKEEPPQAVVHQGYTWGGEQRKQEDLAKFRELLGENPEGLGVVPREGGSSVGAPALTIQSAIEFLASQVKTNADKARMVHKLKTAWKGRGSAGTKKKGVSVPGAGYSAAPTITITSGPKGRPKTLLCIHSYPGGNETFARHWPNFQKAGADRIVGIGTTDGKCTWPEGLDDVVDIGKNSYMALKGPDDHLCRRLLDTVKWCLTQPEDRFIIAEYDVLFLKKMPSFKGVQANLTGGQVNGSKTTQFFHSPWCFDRESGPALVSAMEAVLPDSAEYPDNSPDLFFGYACERSGIKVTCNFKHFTRNTINGDEDLSLAIDAALDGAHCLHGCKEDFVYNSIMRALNEKHLSMSHAA